MAAALWNGIADPAARYVPLSQRLCSGTEFRAFNGAGTPDQVGKFIAPDFPFDWMRTMAAQLKQVRPYYYGDYYPLLPCSFNSDCTADAGNERSAAFEWAAWQFNRPEEEDGMVQAFRRNKSSESIRDLRLRGLDTAANYEVTDLDGGSPRTISGRDLMQQGLHLEIASQPGSAIIIYKKVR